MTTASYALGIGSNRRHPRHGAPEGVVAAALAALAAEGIAVRAASTVHRTAPLGPGGRRYANAAAVVETALAPPALLAALKAIERRFGRRRGRRWGARVIDLDIMLWSGGAWRSRPLVIPHAGLAHRRFVLDPLVEVAPEWRIPGGGTVRQAHARLRAAR
ncbi:MAG: 2-amino-4-hydroxy-6-hydroxymethyldihydropteridine diphosphokinase [Sphingomonas fennica]